MESSSEESSSVGGSDFWTDDMPRLVTLLRRTGVAPDKGKRKIKTLRQVAELLEPSYDTFYCPLTRKVMEDPVTIASGVTCERRAVARWFDENGAVCPKTREGLRSAEVESNVALKVTIMKWRRRSECARIKLACVALTLGGTDAMATDATWVLPRLCRRSARNLELARELGAAGLLGQQLELEGSKLRCEALKALSFFLADEDAKEKVGTRQIEMTVRLLSSEDPAELRAAVSFLLELSKSAVVCKKIGLVPGAILMLISLKFNKLIDESVKEKASKTLKNLESFPSNIKLMAEDGFLEPLLRNLVEGPEPTKVDMATHLGKLTLPPHTDGHVSPQAISTLLDMAKDTDPRARTAGLDALAQISSYPTNANTLVQFGAVPLMVQPMFMGSALVEPSSASTWHDQHFTIVANIFDNLDQAPQSLQIDSQGHTMASPYAIHNLTDMLSPKAPTSLSHDVLRILLSLASSPESKKSVDRISNAIREAGTVQTLVGFAGSDDDLLAVASLRLLSKLTAYMPAAISESLREAPILVPGLDSNREVTDRHVASVELLAGLPRDDPTLNRALIDSGAIPTVLRCMEELQSSWRAVVTGHAKLFLQGLVGILVRFTSTCDADTCNIMIEKDMATVFANMLGSASEEILTLSALGLKNLSTVSSFLSKPVVPIEEKGKFAWWLTRNFRLRRWDGNDINNTKKKKKKKRKKRKEEEEEGGDVNLCSVHGGTCSEKTFCLVKTAGAVERLLECVEHESDAVVDAALSALQTLLDGEGVDGENGVRVLGEKGGVRALVGVAGREERGEGVRQRALWVIHKFLSSGMFVEEIRNDKVLCSVLIRRLYQVDGEVKQMCESILRCLNRMPNR